MKSGKGHYFHVCVQNFIGPNCRYREHFLGISSQNETKICIQTVLIVKDGRLTLVANRGVL